MNIYHMDLKTAFLQGEAYDETRNIICQVPPEANQPWYMVARMKKPAYGLNDAPRRWWNVVDKQLRQYECVPTRADRCTYVLYSKKQVVSRASPPLRKLKADDSWLTTPDTAPAETLDKRSVDAALDYLLDPVAGNNANGMKPVIRHHLSSCR